MSRWLQMDLVILALLLTPMDFCWGYAFSNLEPSLYERSELTQARHYKTLHPWASPEEIAENVLIPEEYRELLTWMVKDLENYLANFDALFSAKLGRIREHHSQRLRDLDTWLEPLRQELQARPEDHRLRTEMERLTHELKPQGFVEDYQNARDFTSKYVGLQGKILKTHPTAPEVAKMNQVQILPKLLYVDTWAVPFFNTATQSIAQARAETAQATQALRRLGASRRINLKQFTDAIAVFARPEFDDLRRFKLKFFPTLEDRTRFAGERSDAMVVGKKFPDEGFAFTNQTIELDPLSYSFGQRIHAMGLISHSRNDIRVDGRIFTGPADFLEHDQAHAFFNIFVPGTSEEWFAVHSQFHNMLKQSTSPGRHEMMRLVYFHLTHESGYRTLLRDRKPAPHDYLTYDGLPNDLREKIRTRYYYDWVPAMDVYGGNYEAYLAPVFNEVGGFFKRHFLRIQSQHFARTCGL